MLRHRLLAAAAILVPLLVLIWLDDASARPGLWLGPVAIGVSVIAAAEAARLLANAGLSVARLPAIAGAVVVVASTLAPLAWEAYPDDCPLGKPGWALLGLSLAVALVFSAELFSYRVESRAAERLVSGVFIVVYAGFLLSFLVQLRLLDLGHLKPGRIGLVALIGSILVVKLSDTGAYFTGRAIGRRKLAPGLSPGKTVEGVAGGICSGTLSGLAVGLWLLPGLAPAAVSGPWWAFALFGASVTVAGVLGDLAESLLKREARCKDSSAWMPGLGGVLDVLDSLLAAAPVAFVWWISGLLVR